MKLLVLGGTKFLGRAVVDAAVEAGHNVTIFTRGATNPDLYPQLERLRGDLETGDLDALRGREWDRVIDLGAVFVPGQVREYAGLLANAVEHFTLVGTIEVYADHSRPYDETSPLKQPPSPEPDRFDLDMARANRDLYGELKVGAEQAVGAIYGERVGMVRCGWIVGPHDNSNRMLYWIRRLAEGGDVLAPGEPSRPIQFIDARDLGMFILKVSETKLRGPYNGIGPAKPMTMQEMLGRIAREVGSEPNLVWLEDRKLLDAGVIPSYEMPSWTPAPDKRALMEAGLAKSLAAGLTLRPLEETVRDSIVWADEAGIEVNMLTREKEQAVLGTAGG